MPKPSPTRHILHKIFNRLTLTGLLLLLQFVWLCWFMLSLSQYAVGINLLFSVLSVVLALYIVRREDAPAYKISWILVLCALPLFGLLIYVVFGNKRPSRRMKRKIEAVEQAHPLPESAPLPDTLPRRFRATCDYLAREGFPAYENTDVQYYPLGERLFEDLLVDLEEAQHYIFLEYFIISEGKMLDRLLEVLARKAAQGVDVRILYDDFGCEVTSPLTFTAKAERLGIRCLGFNRVLPFLSILLNHRDHRKITVIDGRIAYTGGINVADEYINEKVRFGHWKDSGLRLQGPAVHSFVSMFLNLWNAFCPTDESYDRLLAPHQPPPPTAPTPTVVLPYADSPLDDEAVGKTVYLDILAQATDYVYIFTPYLIIDSEMQTALCTAAKRGVDVRIVTPGIPDKKIAFRLTRSFYPVLLRAGVKIYEYTPGFLHAKSFVCDDSIAVVGTINMDFRSLYLHFECATLVYGGEAIASLKQDCLDTMAASHLVVPRDFKRPRRLWQSLIDAILRTLSPLF